MSNSPDPQTWVFPPLGAAVLPHDVSAAFGPISRGDKIKLEWTPTSSTPEVAFICADGGDTYVASNGNTSPYTYTFTQSIDNGTSHICWFFFPGTQLGNTLTFRYNNAAAGSSSLWQQNSQIAQAFGGGSGSNDNNNNNGAATTTIISTVTQTKTLHVATGGGGSGTAAAAAATTIVSTSISTETITQAPHTLLTTIANPSTTFVSTSVELIPQTTASSTPADAGVGYGSSSGSGVSAGEAAGITAAGLVLLALLAFGIWALLRRRAKRAGYTQGASGPPNTPGLLGMADTGAGPVLVPATYKYQSPAGVQGQSLIQGYYSPVSGAAEAGSKERPLHEASRRTVHEMAE